MDGNLLFILLVVCTASSAVAIKCRVCAALGICTEGEIGELQTCPRVPGFVTNQCSKFDGEMSGTVLGNPFSFKGVIRSCNPLPKNMTALPLRCFSGANITSQFDSVMKSLVVEGVSVGEMVDMKITGTICYCAGDGCNGVASLKPLLWLTSITVGLMLLLLM